MQRVRTTTRTAGHKRSADGAHAARRSRGGAGLRRFIALLLLVPTFLVQAAATESAGAAVVAGFEIDGDTPVNGGGHDWATTGTRQSDPVGNADLSTFKGSKEFEHPSTWEIGTGLAPNQDDISDVYIHDAVVDDDIWGFVGFRRFTTSGVTNFDVEFNKQQNAGGSAFEPIRSVGDVMVRFEQDGNKGFKLTNAYFWRVSTGAGWSGSCLPVSGYTPTAGWCPVDINLVPFTGTTGEDGHFGEGAFNLTSLLELGGGDITCLGGNFGTMNIRTFTGNADESALKDYVDAVSIDVGDTCGAMEIHKIDQFGNAVPGATFSISPNPIPGQSASPLVITEGGAGDPDGTADGTIVIDPASPGTYTVVETAAPAGYELPQPLEARTWTVTVGKDGVGSVNTPLTVTDRRLFAAPTIVNAPSYDVDHNWQVIKFVTGPKTADVPEGTDATFPYEVRLKALEPTTSGFGGTVTVTNPNTLPMVGTLSTEVTGGAACTVSATDVSGAPGLQVDLASGANPFTYTCPATALPGGTTATVQWAEATYPSAEADETYTRSDSRAFVIDEKTDETTTVTDTFDGGVPQDLGTFDWSTVRAVDTPIPHTVVVATYSRDIAGAPGKCTGYTDTARESADGTSDSETVTVCVGRNLDVTKDATLGYQRELLWDIAKSGPGTVWVGEDEQGDLRRTVNFTIDVTADGVSDSEWALTGTIMIDNPNEWPVTVDVTDTVVVDSRTIECVIDGGAQVVVPAGAVDHPVTYDCPGVEQGDYVGENTVTIDWSTDSHAYPRTSDSDTVDVEVTGDPEPANATITLSDELDGSPVTLPVSTLDWADVHAMTGDDTANPPLAPHTRRMTYSVELEGGAGACVPYDNVVTIDQTKQSDGHTVTLCSPGVTKSVKADYGRKQLWDLTKDVDRTFVEVGPDGEARFDYTVTATPGQVVPDGTASWSGTVVVTNPSADTALTVDVDDVAAVPGWTCELVGDASNVEIGPADSVELAYECTGSGHESGTNTATVGFGGETVSRTVDVTFAPRPGITDSTTTLTDDIPDDGLPSKQFDVDAAGGPDVFTYSRTLGAPAGACAAYTNTAVLALTGDDLSKDRTVRVCEEAPLGVEVEGSGSYGVTYPWSIDKDVDKTSVEVDAATGRATFDYDVTVTAGDARPADWTMAGQVTVTNPNAYAEGDIEITDLDVTSDVGGGAVCTATLPAEPVVAHDDELVVPFGCTFTGDPDTSGTVTAVVAWDPAGAASSDTASDTSDVVLSVGEEVDRFVDVWDDKTDPDDPVLLEEDLEWSEGLVKTYDYQVVHHGVPGRCADFTNTARLDLAGPDDPQDSTTATVCVEQPLELAVEGSADLVRDHAWSIAKVADATQRTVDGSGNATFTYTVTARAGAATDSGWRLQGSVTVDNPNQYAAGDITADVTAATTMGGGAVCTVAGGTDVLIAEDGSATLPITCTFGSEPAGSGTLRVTATWDPAGEVGSASVTEETGPIAFGVRSETNRTVEVVDDQTVAGRRTVLDPALTWAEGLVRSYTYSLTLAGGAVGACRSWTNTATVDQPMGTDPTASAAVLVCTPVVPPPPEVAPEQAFGKAVGSVKATCQGTVRARLANRSGERVVYKLRVGKLVHSIRVRSLASRKFVTRGRAMAKVTLKVGSTRLDKLRIPARCQAPEVLPDTGLRGTSE